MGLWSTTKGEPHDRKVDIFENLGMLPHAYVFFVNMVIVFLLANQEINARVAFTCPFFFMAFS